MKININSKIIYYFFSVLLALFFICYPIFIHLKLNNSNDYFAKNNIQERFLKIWHIDDFEGGSGNRAVFLEKVARQFEKEELGTYIIVQSLTAEEVLSALTNGDLPDLISFSHYSGYMLQNVFQNYLGQISIRSDLLEYAKLDGEIKALPWYLSGYCLIGNTSNSNLSQNLSTQTMFSFNIEGKTIKPSLCVGLGNNNLALLSAIKNNAQIAGTDNIVRDFDKLSTFQAYSDYCFHNSATVLLGTARDFYRVKNKISLGSMTQCEFYPLGSFSDLVGYMGITAIDETNYMQATKFLEFLTSKKIQSQLSSIGLFSTLYDKIYFDDEDYIKFENVLQRNLSSINIFMSQNEKEKLWRESINAIFGNTDSLKYVKKYL